MKLVDYDKSSRKPTRFSRGSMSRTEKKLFIKIDYLSIANKYCYTVLDLNTDEYIDIITGHQLDLHESFDEIMHIALKRVLDIISQDNNG